MAQTKTAASKTSASKNPVKKSAAKQAAKKAPAKPALAKAAAAKTAKGAATKSKPKAGESEVTVDRRRAAERRTEEAAPVVAAAPAPAAPAAKLERREKVSRRRQIDPTTCERDYSDAEVEFMSALDAYKRRSGRMFPTCSEVLEVIREIGYVRLSAAEMAMVQAGRGDACGASVEDAAEAEALEALRESEDFRDE